MKRILLLLIVLSASIRSVSQNNFKIVGTTPVDIKATVYLIVNRDTLQCPVENMQFSFEGHVDAPTRVTMRSAKNCGSQFFIEPGNMHLTTTVNQKNGACIFKKELRGSATQDSYDKFNDSIKKIRAKYKGVKGYEEEKSYVSRFVSQNPNSVVATHAIQASKRAFGYDWTKATFELLSSEQKNSLEGIDIRKSLAQHNLLRKGNTIVDFVQTDIHDSAFHLSSLRGHYVLIDFWASWCGPCRKENPNIKNVYQKYHYKGFEVVGVSLDDEAKKWKKAVEIDGLPWIHISDLKGWNNEIVSAFAINSIPMNILLDKEGKIIATDLRGNELERAGQNCFNKDN